MARNDRREHFIDFLSSLPAPVAAELIRKLTGKRRLSDQKNKNIYRKHRFIQRRA